MIDKLSPATRASYLRHAWYRAHCRWRRPRRYTPGTAASLVAMQAFLAQMQIRNYFAQERA